MSKQEIYECIVLTHVSGHRMEMLSTGVEFIVANSKEQAIVQATARYPERIKKVGAETIEVLVRPFLR